MTPRQRIFLAIDILYRNCTTKEESKLFSRLMKIWRKRYFRYATIPHTWDGDKVDMGLVPLFNLNNPTHRLTYIDEKVKTLIGLPNKKI